MAWSKICITNCDHLKMRVAFDVYISFSQVLWKKAQYELDFLPLLATDVFKNKMAHSYGKYVYISKNKLGMEFIFYIQINVKFSTRSHCRFLWKWQDMPNVSKIGSCKYFWNKLRKKYRICLCFLLCDTKNLDILRRSSHVCCYLFLGDCGQKWVL